MDILKARHYHNPKNNYRLFNFIFLLDRKANAIQLAIAACGHEARRPSRSSPTDEEARVLNSVRSSQSVTMCSHGLRLSLALLSLVSGAASEYSTKTDSDYDFGDYRGKWCLDEHGFVYNIGEIYYPSPTSCPCTCTNDGPLCVKPQCPRIHPRCTRIRYQSCCPVCEAVGKACVHAGKTYKVLEEFKLSRCEKCRCAANRQVYCTVSECPALHCVNPTYEPHHCCPVCKSGPNCFAGNTVIPAGVRVEVDEHTVCFCSYKDGTWETHPQATCEEHRPPDASGGTSEQMVEERLTPPPDLIP
ncbi:hypothetical protein ANANG_G00297660 [Anguilla anguilla]|uniref:VWFC domain-containing protein n=2 Tax=Anguilla anguilla TaxID=7936 RepID=A0A9D3LM67_ANGAN|nr:hypothetical protein ANANG_G00297660 [Anguilla anguilla]